MASGRVHARVAFTAASATTIAAWSGRVPWPFAWGAWFGWFATPDLDMPITTHEERRLYGLPLLGWAIGLLWEWYWFPYARIIPHRSFLSHFPPVGAATRLLYASLPLLAWSSWTGDWSWFNWHLAWQVYLGVQLQDWLHYLLDGGRLR